MSSDPEEVSPEPQPEAIAPDFPPRVGKYEILGRLGSGAMGVVYHARDPLLERDVALKVMLPQIARDPEQKHRFEREARAVARMMHPNVVTVFDLGYHADGSPYIAMEFLSGNDLFHMMRATPPLSLERKVAIVVSVLEGLAHAHKVGIVHRDIKPANVFLTGEGGVKIMDFGVARFAMGNITGTGMVVGTAEYMSPEQVRGEVVDGRSDLFAAGAMLYELVRGSRPFHADGIMAIFYKITHDDPAFDFPYTPEYRALIPILGKALAKDAAARYQNATEFADALRPFTTGLGMRAPATTVLPTPTPAPAPAAPAPVRAKEEAPAPPTAVLPPPVPAIIEDRRTIVDPSPLFQLIREIFVGGRTGHLHFTRAKEWRSLRFLKGQILHATSDVEGEHLGDVLVRYGLLTQDDLERARTVVLAERKKLGTVLDAMGLMAKGELESSIKLHVREVLFNVTEMPDVKFSFEELGEDTFLETELQSRVAPGEMILEAARRIQEPAVVTAVLGDIDRVIAPASHPVLGAQKLTLTPTDGFVLSRVDGTLTAREVFHLTPLPAEDTERSLFALLCTGAVEYRAPAPRPRTGARSAESASTPGTASHKVPPPSVPPPAPAPPAPPPAPAAAPPAAAKASPPPAPKTEPVPSEAARRATAESRRREIQELHDGLRTKDHFEVLGIARSATADEVKDAYFRLARPYHPDASLDPSLEDLRDKRSVVFIRLGEAYETLRNPTSRKRYETAFPPRRGAPRPEPPAPPPAPKPEPRDPALDEQAAARDFAKAQRLMGEEKYWDAIQLLEEAIPRLEATASRRARVMLARAYMKNPKWRHRAEEVLGQVVREAPDAPEPYLVLGELYRGAQLRARAAAMYRKALQLSPRNEEALNALRAIDAEDRPPGGDSGSGNKARKR